MSASRARRVLLFVGLLGILIAAAGAWYLYRGPYLRGMHFPRAAEATIAQFTALSAPRRADYESIAAYMLEGFVVYADPGFASARYPGWHAGGARRAEELEGFSRIAPLAAAWMEHRANGQLRLSSGRDIDVATMLRAGLLAGTDPGSPHYWGVITDRDQRTAEAADLALALWLSRDSVWQHLDAQQRAQIARWLLQVNGKAIADNNWHLFVAQVNVALAALGAEYDAATIEAHLARVLEFQRPDGWFTDGPGGPIDYYNAWGFYYHLGWIHRMDPQRLAGMLQAQLPRFADDLVHLLGPHGMPIMGRSVCYRLAVTAPLTFASSIVPDTLQPSRARRALDLTWRYFLSHGALRDGRVTQGYCGDDPAILDNYSGPASCLWSLRSLIVALDLPPEAAFWTSPATPLPVEIKDFQRPIAGGHWLARGDRVSGDVVLVNPEPWPATRTVLASMPWQERIRSLVRGTANRPKNEEAKYHRPAYGSREPFCGCSE